MGILDKIKGFFKKEEVEPVKSNDIPLENEVLQEKVEEIIPREVVANCILCNQPIYKDERTRELNGNTGHKRCVKKAIKGTLNGEKLEDLFK